MRSKNLLVLLLIGVLLFIAVGVVAFYRRTRIVESVRRIVIGNQQYTSASPLPVQTLWTELEDTDLGRVQLRGTFVSLSGGKLRLLTNQGEREIVLPIQMQYECMAKETIKVETGKPFPASNAYINLMRQLNSIGKMTSLSDVQTQLMVGDEIIVVGSKDAQGVVRGQLVVTIKC